MTFLNLFAIALGCAFVGLGVYDFGNGHNVLAGVDIGVGLFLVVVNTIAAIDNLFEAPSESPHETKEKS